MSREVVFMYSGQGAQYYQMGRELFEQDAAYRAALERYSRLAGPVGGRDLVEILFSRPLADSADFDRLAETHPLILAVSLALTDALAAHGIEPDRVLGYSLGETIAAVVSGALTAEEAFWAVRAQAAVFERRAEPGRLVAVLASSEIIGKIMSGRLEDRTYTAAINAPGHFVVGLADGDIAEYCGILRDQDVSHAVLPIRYAFHTPLIEAAGKAFADIADQLNFCVPRLPVHSCAAGGEIPAFEAGHFWRVARGVVRFYETAAPLANGAGAALVDVGPSGTLAGFVRLAAGETGGSAGRSTGGALAVMNQFGRDTKTLQHVVERLS